MRTGKTCYKEDPSTCRIHGNNPGVKAYEKIVLATQVPAHSFGADAEKFVKIPLKNLSPLGLSLTLIHQVAEKNMNVKKINESLVLAAELHQNDHRAQRGPYPVTAYIEHPLRNTVRAIRFGVTSEEILMGSLLHDTVEDHPFEISAKLGFITDDEHLARTYALKYIEKQFGSRVRKMVEGMSNPISENKYTPAEIKNKIYAEHVEEAIKDPDVFVGKVCDFIDNAVGLHHNVNSMNPVGVKKRATKYLPVCDILLKQIEKAKSQKDFPVPLDGLERMEAQIKQGKISLTRLKKQFA